MTLTSLKILCSIHCLKIASFFNTSSTIWKNYAATLAEICTFCVFSASHFLSLTPKKTKNFAEAGQFSRTEETILEYVILRWKREVEPRLPCWQVLSFTLRNTPFLRGTDWLADRAKMVRFCACRQWWLVSWTELYPTFNKYLLSVGFWSRANRHHCRNPFHCETKGQRYHVASSLKKRGTDVGPIYSSRPDSATGRPIIISLQFSFV